MAFDLTILGAASATPTSDTFPTAQLLSMREQFFLIDCGEGTQQQLRRNKAKFSRIHHIFISHLHGDHYFGLIGLISSFHLLRRDKPLHVYGPPALKEIILTQLKASKTWLTYPLHFHETTNQQTELLLETDKVLVYSFPLKHSIATTGFRFEEKPQLRKLRVEAIEEHAVPTYVRRNLQLGKDWVKENGDVIPNTELTVDPPAPLKYAFCSDTAYHEPVIGEVREVDLLYHEATFTRAEEKLARETRHSTASEAAQVAKAASVRHLVIGHYSSRYADQSVHLAECKDYFPNVTAGIENMRIHVDHDHVHVI